MVLWGIVSGQSDFFSTSPTYAQLFAASKNNGYDQTLENILS